MVSNIIDSFVYAVGVSTIGIALFKWDKKFYVYNSSVKTYRKVYNLKYGLIPEIPYYQKMNKYLEWETVSDKEHKNIKKDGTEEDFDNNFLFELNDLQVSLTVNKTKTEGIKILNNI